jgi:hypothetical protein
VAGDGPPAPLRGIERIVDCRGGSLQREYLVQWSEPTEADGVAGGSWCKAKDLTGCAHLVKDFHAAAEFHQSLNQGIFTWF